MHFPGDEVEEGDETLERFGLNTFTRPRELTNNVALVTINLPDFFDKLDFVIDYSNIDLSYKGREFDLNERNTNIFKGTIIIKPLPKINITTGYEYHDIRFDSAFSSDSILKSIPFDIYWQPTVKSTFFLNTRYNRRDYGRNKKPEDFPSGFENYTGYDATLGYRFNVTERDNLTIKFERSLKEQQFQTQPTPSGERIGDNNPYYFTQINMDYIHRFPRGNFSFRFSPALQHIKFREKQFIVIEDPFENSLKKRQKVDMINLEISARYDAPRKWLFGEISYRYNYRDNSLPNRDLVKNVARISVGLNF